MAGEENRPLRINCRPTFQKRVPFSVAGEAEPAVVLFEFRHKSPDELKQWAATFGGRDTAAALSEVVVRWVDGVIDEHDAQVPFSESAFREFLAAQGSRSKELMAEYLAELQEGRRKNLLR